MQIIYSNEHNIQIKMKQSYRSDRKTVKRTKIFCWAIFTLSTLSILNTSCKKFVQVPTPITSLNSANVYKSDATASAVLTGIYTKISSTGVSSGLSSTSVYCGLSADEFTLYNPASEPGYVPFYQNSLTNANLAGGDFWVLYQTLYIANSAVEGLTNNNSLTPAVDQQLHGEAKFIRAFCYFYLVNLYGDVPLITGTDYKSNELMSRTPKALVYQQIITDLKEAQSLLSDQYLDGTLLNPTSERVRPTKWAATALLARTYLYTGDWADAVTEANLVIGNSNTYSLSALNSVYLKNSSEAIWELQPVNSRQNTPDGLFFILPVSGPNLNKPIYLNSDLINSFESGDQRLTNWVGKVTATSGGVSTNYYYPYKYKVNVPGAPVTEYEIVLRLAEQFLIRAEAEAQGTGTGTSGAVNDLNVVRNRAGLPNYAGPLDKASLLTAILHERQIELFSEWGHRWLDLKRTGNVDAVMSIATPKKGGSWQTNKQLYPLPQADLQNDHNLTQNMGY